MAVLAGMSLLTKIFGRATKKKAEKQARADVLNEAGTTAEEEELYDEEEEESDEENESVASERPLTLLEQLQVKLGDAVEQEDYERAAQIRDEIDRVVRSSNKS